MAQFVAFQNGVEVNGETVLSVVNGSPLKDMALDILGRHGIIDPKPGMWYAQQDWLDAFKEISEKIGDGTLLTIGLAIPKNAKFPPEIDNTHAALASIDVAYHMNHRRGDIGSYKYEKTGDNSAKMVCRNPYPCSFDNGIIVAIARKFSLGARVVHDNTQPCRKKGADCCTYNVMW
jgi:hypothetical protein